MENLIVENLLMKQEIEALKRENEALKQAFSMAVEIQIVKVYCEILKETSLKVLVINSNHEKFMGGLLENVKDRSDEKIVEIIESEKYHGKIENVIEEIMKMEEKAGLKVYETSFSTLAWWGYLNGLFPLHIKK